MSRFSNQSVLITGASGGLGKQLALDFAKEGARLTLNYSGSHVAAHALADQINQNGGEAIACRADISSSREVNSMVEKAVAHFGGIDILVNNAGINVDAPFLELSEEDWDRVIDINLKGPFWYLRRSRIT